MLEAKMASDTNKLQASLTYYNANFLFMFQICSILNGIFRDCLFKQNKT